MALPAFREGSDPMVDGVRYPLTEARGVVLYSAYPVLMGILDFVKSFAKRRCPAAAFCKGVHSGTLSRALHGMPGRQSGFPRFIPVPNLFGNLTCGFAIFDLTASLGFYKEF